MNKQNEILWKCDTCKYQFFQTETYPYPGELVCTKGYWCGGIVTEQDKLEMDDPWFYCEDYEVVQNE